jgi:hypothetical protein
MGALGRFLRTNTEGLSYRCPGCNWVHSLPKKVTPEKPGWTWNGSIDRPSFAPSVNVTTIRPNLTREECEEYDKVFAAGGRNAVLADPRFRFVCHSVVTDGKISFCSDCTHHLVGQTVDMVPFHKEEERNAN